MGCRPGRLSGAPPCPVSVIAPAPDAAALQELVDAGVAAWLPALDVDALRTLLSLAPARHRHEADLRQALAQARAQIDERKWVDRAKGLLMSARNIAEDDAFKLLRGAAMHANLKLAEVSRAVIDAARWAEAVNRAGQLRMLSQRVVALAAQRLARVEPARARSLQAQALQRARANIDHIGALGLAGDAAVAFAAVGEHWTALDTALAARASSDTLAQADRRAEDLLQAADRLTDVLEAQGARRSLAIVNLCGSQRMRVQRLAKDALLSRLLPDAERAERSRATMAEFEEVQRRIESAPLSSPEIRAAGAASQEGWLTLLRAWRVSDPAALVHASETLLQSLERLTDSCEHSLQVLMS